MKKRFFIKIPVPKGYKISKQISLKGLDKSLLVFEKPKRKQNG